MNVKQLIVATAAVFVTGSVFAQQTYPDVAKTRTERRECVEVDNAVAAICPSLELTDEEKAEAKRSAAASRRSGLRPTSTINRRPHFPRGASGLPMSLLSNLSPTGNENAQTASR